MLNPGQPNDPKSKSQFPPCNKFCSVDLRKRLEKAPVKDTGHAEFLSYMSHEMRTPLTAILGFTQTIKMSHEFPDFVVDHEQYIDHIDVSAQQLMKVVQTMLSYLEDVCDIETARRNGCL